MFYRSVAALIVVFWVTMTTLLIRSEVDPGDSRMREVPTSHVLKLLFLHQQPSELSIQYQKNPVGRLRVHPQVRRDDGTRVMDFVGNAQISLPGLSRERVSWEGTVELSRELELRRVRVGLNTRGSDRYRIDVDHDAVTGKGRYDLKAGDVVMMSRPYSLDPAGRAALLQQANISPDMIAMIQGAMASAGAQDPLVIGARQATLDFQGTPIETSLVTFRQGMQRLMEIHISQLGQVLHADTMLGYSLVPE